jgi:hypothetical protein
MLQLKPASQLTLYIRNIQLNKAEEQEVSSVKISRITGTLKLEAAFEHITSWG